MSTANSGRTRARDIDRAESIGTLDSAYSEGQLGAAEYHDRIAQARSAKTLGELAELVADLQHRPPLPAAARRVVPDRRRQRLVVLCAGALVAAFGAFTLTSGLTREPEQPVVAPPAASAPEVEMPRPGSRPDLDEIDPVIVATPDLVTAEGFAHFLNQYRDYFDDMLVDEVTIHPDHAGLERAVPGQLNRRIDYDYRAGFEQRRDITTRKTDTPVIDLATVDTAAIGAILPTAAAVTGVPDGWINMIRIEIFSFPPARGLPVVAVYVRNDFDESGRMVLSPAGEVLRVWQFEG